MRESAVQVCRRRRIWREMNEVRGRFANQDKLRLPELVNLGWRIRTVGREMSRYFAGEWSNVGRLRNAEQQKTIAANGATSLLRTQALLFQRMDALSREMLLLRSSGDYRGDVPRLASLFRTCDAVWIAHESKKAKLTSV